MSINIYTDNTIQLDGKPLNLKVIQRRDGTVVYTPESLLLKQQYKEHKMPHWRYSLVHDAPSSGVAGRAQFEADIRELLKNVES